MHYISSDHCNAWSLVKGLLKRGLPGEGIRVVSRHTLHLCAGLVEAVPSLPEDLLASDTVWPTEESTLAALWSRPVRAKVWPASLGSLPLDDKQAFAAWAMDRGDDVVPFEPYTGESACPMGYPAALRLRHSWRDGQRRPKGRVVENTDQAVRLVAKLAQQGVGECEYFWQAYLPGPPEHTVSVAGWFGPREREPVYLVTRKVAQDREPIGTGIAVEQIHDPAGLADRACSLLEALAYRGPFELEYLFDPSTGTFRLLELNPRFWMQHGLVDELFEQAVLRRALEEAPDGPHGLLPNLGASWLFTEGWLEALARGRCRLAGLRRRLKGRGPLVEAPDWPTARRFLKGRIRDKLAGSPRRQPV